MIRINRGWSGKREVMKFSHSVTDMECEFICESKSKLLECGDSGSWGRIWVTIELAWLCSFPIVIGQVEDSFWAWEAHHSLEYYIEVTLGLAGMNVSWLVGWMSKRKCWRMGPHWDAVKASRRYHVLPLSSCVRRDVPVPSRRDEKRPEETCGGKIPPYPSQGCGTGPKISSPSKQKT